MRAPIILALLILAGSTAQAFSLSWPLPAAGLRPTPLYFGLYVTPDPNQNPIDPPERFTGYHAAVDFEIHPAEEQLDIPVYAICPGTVVYSGYAEGYGGLLVHRCTLQGEPVTVLYGHLRLEGLPATGTNVHKGQQIGSLAPGRTYESGENRKHLHLGIHKGEDMDVRGYVQNEKELEQYIDPLTVLPQGFL